MPSPQCHPALIFKGGIVLRSMQETSPAIQVRPRLPAAIFGRRLSTSCRRVPPEDFSQSGGATRSRPAPDSRPRPEIDARSLNNDPDGPSSEWNCTVTSVGVPRRPTCSGLRSADRRHDAGVPPLGRGGMTRPPSALPADRQR